MSKIALNRSENRPLIYPESVEVSHGKIRVRRSKTCPHDRCMRSGEG